ACKRPIEILELEKIQAPMQRRDGGLSQAREHGKMHEVCMEMQNVEACGEAFYLFQHRQLIRNMVADPRIDAKGLLTTRHQPTGGLGCPARKERDLMPLRHEFLGEVGDRAFGAAIKARGHTFDEGSDLSYFHGPHWRSTLPKRPGLRFGSALAGATHPADFPI